jgi:hypothetical protein
VQVLPQLEPRQRVRGHRRREQAQLHPLVPQQRLEPLPEGPQPAVPQPAVPQPVVPQPVVRQPTVPQPAVPQPAVPQPVVPQPVDGEDGELESARRARPTLPRKL